MEFQPLVSKTSPALLKEVNLAVKNGFEGVIQLDIHDFQTTIRYAKQRGMFLGWCMTMGVVIGGTYVWEKILDKLSEPKPQPEKEETDSTDTKVS